MEDIIKRIFKEKEAETTQQTDQLRSRILNLNEQETIANEIKKKTKNVAETIKDTLMVNAMIENNLDKKNIVINNINYVTERLNADLKFWIREDVLPQLGGKKISFFTMPERLLFVDCVKHRILNKISNGDIIDFKENYADKNIIQIMPLLHNIKLIDYLPNKELYNNPFYQQNNYDNFWIWTAGYPIMYNAKINAIQCKKNNIVLNLRIYNLSEQHMRWIK